MATMTTSTSADPAAVVDPYDRVRALTEQLAAPLSPEDQVVQSMPDVSPTKWHRAHTTWFFENFVLVPNAPGYRVFHPEYCYLFNSYYEAVGSRHPRDCRGLLSRPGSTEIAEYRAHVDRGMRELLGRGVAPDLAALIELGLHHEQQHQELLLMDIKHVLSVNPLEPVYQPSSRPPGRARALGWVEHDGGLVDVGHAGDGFAFDNESPRHTVLLQLFALADRPVTCSEWQAFIADDGYQRSELWLSDAWALVQAEEWEAPLYWRRDGDGWNEFTLAGACAVDPAQPVCHVSYYEADAYARWAGSRLPIEAEWEAVAAREPAVGRFLDVAVLHPSPPGDGELALFGDVWEWTASAYLPYPGFRPAAGAVGEYNGKFMVNQHVLRGGGCATPPGHMRATYRNFFPPSARWPFAGVRLARDLEGIRS
jgi:ergothioneine biosynthesis protein EgtB